MGRKVALKIEQNRMLWLVGNAGGVDQVSNPSSSKKISEKHHSVDSLHFTVNCLKYFYQALEISESAFRDIKPS